LNIRDFDVDSSNEHPACLQSIHFAIRDKKLNMTIMMRSNDAVQATYMNAVGFIALQKKVAVELDVPVGSYTHISYSFHAYENCFDKLEKYAEAIETKDINDLTYHYEGFYDQLMQDEIPSILSMVKDQKQKYNVE
jgi:thymidylate synthase